MSDEAFHFLVRLPDNSTVKVPVLHPDPAGDFMKFLADFLPIWLHDLLAPLVDDPFTRPPEPYRECNGCGTRADVGTGLGKLPWRKLPPSWSLNSLWIPSGASRFSIGIFLVPAENLQVYLNCPWTPSIHWNTGITLYPLNAYTLRDLAVIVLADIRQQIALQGVTVTDARSWSDLFTAAGNLLPAGVSMEADVNNNAPPPEPYLWQRSWPLGHLIDMAAVCQGHRVTFRGAAGIHTIHVVAPGSPRDALWRQHRDMQDDPLKCAVAEAYGVTSNYGRIGQVTVTFPIAEYVGDGITVIPTNERIPVAKTVNPGAGKVLVKAAQLAWRDGGQIRNQADVDSVAQHIANVIYQISCEPRYFISKSNFSDVPNEPTHLDDWVWIQLWDGQKPTIRVLIASLPPYCFPLEWPIGYPVLFEEPSSASSSSSSVSESSSTSESSGSSESSGPSESSAPSESQPPSESWSGSDKSSAIVPASWSPTGYVALFIHEMPEVRFDDVMVVEVEQKNQEVPIDFRFAEVCEKGSLEVCGFASDKPAAIKAKVVGDKVQLAFEEETQEKIRIVLRLTGIRRGFAGKRFPRRTREQFLANEAFINSAYPSDPRAE